MKIPFYTEFERTANQLERDLSKRPGRQRGANISETTNRLKTLVEIVSQAPFSTAGTLGPEMYDNLHSLRDRAYTVTTQDEIRAVLRDLKQYMIAASALAHTREMEGALRQIEGSLTSMKQVTDNTPSPVALEEKFLRLEDLKGKTFLFTIMPFKKDFNDVWDGGIKRASSEAGLRPIRIDMFKGSNLITTEIVEAIKLAELIVADVTDNNPNVMFELGYAIALKKRYVIIGQSVDLLPFDIKPIRTLPYENTWSGIEKLHHELLEYIKATLSSKSKIKKSS